MSPHEVGRNGYGGDGKKKRPTYTQDWPSYRLAQHYEGDFFRLFLSDLMDLVQEPPQIMGRPRHHISDVLKAMALKVYGRLSTARSQTPLRDVWRFGYLDEIPSANTIIDYFNLPQITPILIECIEFVALSLRGYEDHFAPDSSGFRTTNYMRWLEEKPGAKIKSKNDKEDEVNDEDTIERKKREWRKVHLIVGTNTEIVVGVHVDGYESSDYAQFEPMFDRVTKLFNVDRISADGGYTGRSNYLAAERWGASAFLPFDARHVRPPVWDQSSWARAYRLQFDYPDLWYPMYHRRSVVETGFSSIKRLFGETLRSKNLDAQVNELLCKILSYNIVVLIHEMFALDLYPFFATDPRFIASIPEKGRARLLARMDGLVPGGQPPVDDGLFDHFSQRRPHDYTNGVNGLGHDPFGLPHDMLNSGW